MKKKLFLLIYYFLASKLPNLSYPGGKYYNRFRVWCLKNIIDLGDGCLIMRNVYVGDGDRIKVGNNCKINEGARLCNVHIGNNVMIARNHVFVGAQHSFERTDIPMVEQGFEWGEPTIISDDVWIGIMCIIMPGIVVKEGCIIGGGAVLTKDTEPYGVYVGNPAKRLKDR